jgi:hypothetical protein
MPSKSTYQMASAILNLTVVRRTGSR